MTSPVFDEEVGFTTDVDVNTSPTELYLPNVPVSLSSSLSLANLTPADLQSLAQALSFSTSVNNAMQVEQQVLTSASVAENLGLSADITFPAVDPNVESNTTQSEVSICVDRSC